MLLSKACIIKQPGEVAALWGTTLMRTYSFSFIPEKSAPYVCNPPHTSATDTHSHTTTEPDLVTVWAASTGLPTPQETQGGGGGVSGYTVD